MLRSDSPLTDLKKVEHMKMMGVSRVAKKSDRTVLQGAEAAHYLVWKIWNRFGIVSWTYDDEMELQQLITV